MKKELVRTKRQRNQALAECSSKKIEIGIMKSTARAIEASQCLLCTQYHLCANEWCVCVCAWLYSCCMQMRMELMERDIHAQKLRSVDADPGTVLMPSRVASTAVCHSCTVFLRLNARAPS